MPISLQADSASNEGHILINGQRIATLSPTIGLSSINFSGSVINNQGTILGITNHITTTRLQASMAGVASPITASSGVLYTSFNVTPKSSTSKLLLLSTAFNVGETSNLHDVMFASASYDSTLIGTVMNYTGANHWLSNLDTTFISFNHMFNSWGTTTKAINIRAGLGTQGTTNSVVVNYPNAVTTTFALYFAMYNSPNQHQVAFTVMEIEI